MKLTIFAATGGVGRHVLEQAVAAGNDATVVVRDPKRVSAKVRAITADLTTADPDALAHAVEGTDAVLSCLGPRSKAEAGVVSQGTRAIVAAMKATDIRRLVVISAAPIGTVPSPGRPKPPKHDPGDGFFIRNLGAPLVKAVFHTQYADLAVMEDVLRDSGLDWTAMRPPRLTDKPGTGAYRTARGQNVRGGRSISRADVARGMLRVLDQADTIGHTIGIAY